MFRNDMSYN